LALSSALLLNFPSLSGTGTRWFSEASSKGKTDKKKTLARVKVSRRGMAEKTLYIILVICTAHFL
jgi:hypothetical protein